MASAARRGDVRRLWSDLKATIGDGCKQAARLQALIETNAGLWLEDGTWLDLSEFEKCGRSSRSSTTSVPRHQPWRSSRNRTASRRRHTVVTSLHDLETIAQVCTARPVPLHYVAVLTPTSPPTTRPRTN